MISNDVQHVYLIIAFHSALCGSILTVIALTLCNYKGICALLLIINNVVQHVNLIAALHLALQLQ